MIYFSFFFFLCGDGGDLFDFGTFGDCRLITGLQHGSVVSLAASSYYGHDQGLVVATQHGGHGGSGNGGPHSPGKYQENGHDTFSDFVTLVCQEAQNTQNAQV